MRGDYQMRGKLSRCITRVRNYGGTSSWSVTIQFGCVGAQVDFQLKPTRKQIRHLTKWVKTAGTSELYLKKGGCRGNN